MRGGFSFCGVNIADIGLEYAPDNDSTYVYAPGKTTVYKETFEGHNGGYLYGTSRDPKEFTLRCYYEDEAIDKGLMARVHHLFRVGKSGMLVFERRPWCYYYATVTEVDPNTMYSYLNGLITIKMEAMYPFARGLEINDHLFYNLETDPYHGAVMANSALFETEEMVPSMSFTNITAKQSVILANPGTERANVGIVIAGSAGDGVIIQNNTTDQFCKYVAFNTNANEYVYTDGINGKTILGGGDTNKLAFLYHDSGFIELEPAYPCRRDIHIQLSSGATTLQTISDLYDTDTEQQWYIGKYIWVGEWRKIQNVSDEHTITLEKPVPSGVQAGIFRTTVCLMNELTINPIGSNTNITRLDFVYKPTFA